MCIVWKYMYVLWVLLTVPLVGNICTVDTNVTNVITNGAIDFYISEKGTYGNGIGANHGCKCFQQMVPFGRTLNTCVDIDAPPRHFVENYICRKCPHAQTFTLTLVVGGLKCGPVG